MDDDNPIEFQPRRGVVLYVPAMMYLSHCEDDVVAGGKATIECIDCAHGQAIVRFKELPGREYGLDYIMENQREWKKRYGDQWARPDLTVSSEHVADD